MPVGGASGDGVSGFLGKPKRATNPVPNWPRRKRFPNGNLFLKIKNKLRNENIF